MGKLKIEINSLDNIQSLLQETYKLADEQIKLVQDEIFKLASATDLKDEPIIAKQTYAKAINDYLSMKDKAIAKKLEIARLLAEIYKHNGDVNATINDASVSKTIDFKKIRDLVNSKNNSQDQKEIIDIK